MSLPTSAWTNGLFIEAFGASRESHEVLAEVAVWRKTIRWTATRCSPQDMLSLLSTNLKVCL